MQPEVPGLGIARLDHLGHSRSAPTIVHVGFDEAQGLGDIDTDLEGQLLDRCLRVGHVVRIGHVVACILASGLCLIGFATQLSQ